MGDYDRTIPDDEITISNPSWFHMERMNDDHIWFTIDGRPFDLHAVNGTLVWVPQEGWNKKDE